MFFFFSSRRRHTRSLCDWSSDVCSSDLVGGPIATLRAERNGEGDGRVYHVGFLADDGRGGQCRGTVTVCVPRDQGRGSTCVDEGSHVRSEERRVGKGGRSGGSRGHVQTK